VATRDFELDNDLSPALEEHWLRQLEAAEKAVEVAKRMLGIIAVRETKED